MENLVVFKCLVKYLGTRDIYNLMLVNKTMYNLFCMNRDYIILELEKKIIYVKIDDFISPFNYKITIKRWDKVPMDIINYYLYEINSSKIFIVFCFYDYVIKNIFIFGDKKLAQDFFCQKVKDNIHSEYDVEIIRNDDVWVYSSSFFEKEMGWVLCCKCVY